MKLKRFLAVFMIAVLLPGCAAGNDVSSTQVSYYKPNMAEKARFPGDFAKVLDVYYPFSFRQSGQLNESALNNWSSMVNRTYPFKINLDSKTDQVTAYSEVVGGVKSGMVYLEPSEILTLIKKGAILPLDIYLKDNEIWNALPGLWI